MPLNVFQLNHYPDMIIEDYLHPFRLSIAIYETSQHTMNSKTQFNKKGLRRVFWLLPLPQKQPHSQKSPPPRCIAGISPNIGKTAPPAVEGNGG
jgi:hypothetical protein